MRQGRKKTVLSQAKEKFEGFRTFWGVDQIIPEIWGLKAFDMLLNTTLASPPMDI